VGTLFQTQCIMVLRQCKYTA